MIPVQLTIQGLYSYQEKQTIDFTRLTEAHLFGIFGTVGSGKSSILEAITFAIYGRTDRLNLSGDNRYYNMMNLKSNELLIDFTFETGKEQTAYRSIVKGKRNSKNYEEVKTLERSAYQKSNGEWIPVGTEVMEQAVGLSYDNFKRTIIIPQGQFQEFLQLGNRDRTQMMKELFNLGKFEFYGKVTSLESKNNARKQVTEGQLQQLGEINPEQVGQFETQRISINRELKELSHHLEELRKKDEAWRKLQELARLQETTANQLKTLLAQEPEYQRLEKQIANYEQCVSEFKPRLESLSACVEKIKQNEEFINHDQSLLQQTEMACAEIGKELAAIKTEYEARDEVRQRIIELSHLIKIRDVEQKLNHHRERIANGEKIRDENDKKIDAQKKRKSELETQIKEEKQNLPDSAALTKARMWYLGKQNLDSQKQESEKQIQKYSEELQQLNQQLQKAITSSPFAELLSERTMADRTVLLKERWELLKKKIKDLEKEADELRLKTRLQAFADQLTEGAPCPLCGSRHHPEIYSASDSNEALQNLHHIKSTIESDIEQINQLIVQLNTLNDQIRYNESHRIEWQEKGRELSVQIEAHSRRFVWDQYSDPARLEEDSARLEQAQMAIKKDENLLEEITGQIDKSESDRERYRVAMEEIKRAVTIDETTLINLKEQLILIDPEQYTQHTAAEMEETKQKLTQHLVQLEKRFSALNDRQSEKRKLAGNLTGKIEVYRRELGQEKERQMRLQADFDSTLKNSKFQSVEEVREILRQTIAVEKEKQKLVFFKEQLAVQKSRYEQITKEINNREYDEEAHQQLITQIRQESEATQKMNQELGKITEALNKLQKDLKSLKTLKKELKELELRAENIKTMKSLFKASGFVNYISSVYLQNLCNAANDRFFQLTRQKMSLEITPDNSFQVRDFMNGGKVRSVKTLSGGQTFQAALSLALALAGNIQKITQSNQNFFFLDEGFGSLDRESLGIVFDTLKTLRKENRIVGVISHVEEMQEEIDVHLRIENHEDNGSKIRFSWLE